MPTRGIRGTGSLRHGLKASSPVERLTICFPGGLTERVSSGSTGISVGLYITVCAIGGSIAGAGFAALLSRVTISGTIIPRESAYAAVWLTCALASLLSLLAIAAARLSGPRN